MSRREFPQGIILLLAATLLAFAGNSLFARLALRDGAIDPVGFTALRLLSGALFLGLLLVYRGKTKQIFQFHPISSISLCVYALAFAVAYVSLDAGLGALILFGTVQITMFSAALVKRETPRLQEWGGMIMAFGGLVWLLSPGEMDISLPMASVMALSGLGWAAYTLNGRSALDATANTAQSFLGATLLVFPLLLIWLWTAPSQNWTFQGVFLAFSSGAVTSGAGYAMWYTILPKLSRGTAAVVQLAVPPITLALSSLLLDEILTFRLIAASVVILLGIGLAVSTPRKSL